jgi:cytochrome c
MHRLIRGWFVVVAGIAVALVASGAVIRAADPEKGKAVFEQCAACHSLDGSGDYDGPTLKGVMGRKAGSLEEYRYSAAMKRSDVTWDAVALDKYVTDPQAFIPGNRMAFAGIGDKTQRDDLIAYLAVATKN